jgi:hypothetical protein
LLSNGAVKASILDVATGTTAKLGLKVSERVLSKNLEKLIPFVGEGVLVLQGGHALYAGYNYAREQYEKGQCVGQP